VNGRDFWRCEYDDGAAGSIYKNYQYIGIASNKCFSFVFVVKYINCGVYGQPSDPAYQKCEQDNAQKGVTLREIENTFKFIKLDDPGKVVKSFYDWYSADKEKNFQTANNRSEVRLIKNNHTAGIYEFFCSHSSNFDIQSTEVGDVVVNNDKAVVTVKVNYCWGSDIFPVELLFVSGGWKIVDVDCDKINVQKEQLIDSVAADLIGRTPNEIVKIFYNWYLSDPRGFTYMNYENCAYRQRPELTANYKKQLDEFINFDQVACTQDTPQKNALITTISINNDQAIVKRDTITIELININGQWKINNIICPRDSEEGVG
jgi:hypothetical protein